MKVRSGPCEERLAELDVVVIVITTAAELLPGVTELGVKLQSGSRPPAQEKLTAPANEAPTGRTLKLWLADCPVLMV
jgi:hypothetical protein